MWNVGAGDLLEPRGNLSELGFVESAREVLADAPEVSTSGSLQKTRTFVGERGERDPSILRIRSPFKHAPCGQAIDQACHPAWRQQDSVGQIAHPKRALRCAAEAQEDVVLGEGHAVLISQVAVERLDDIVMRVEEGLPRSQLGLRQLARRHTWKRTVQELERSRIRLLIFAYATNLARR